MISVAATTTSNRRQHHSPPSGVDPSTSTMMPESTFRIPFESDPNDEKEEETPHLPSQCSRSYCEYLALPRQLPRILYSPPVNFGMVTHSLYRSSFPQKENFAHLRRLGLKSVLYASLPSSLILPVSLRFVPLSYVCLSV